MRQPPLIDRRTLLAGIASVAGGGLATRPGVAADAEGAQFAPPRPFSFETLIDKARALASTEYRAPRIVENEVLDRIDYSNHGQIWFLERYGVWREAGEPGPVHFFHPGKFFKDPVRIHIVEGNAAREVLPVPDAFGYPEGHPAYDLTRAPAYAGFRMLNKGAYTDWLSFLGKSYFRSSGPFDQYGLSARGVAVDPGLASPEEFPRFSQFWLEDRDPDFLVCALLDGPSLTGAYRFRCRRPGDTIMDVDVRLFARRDIRRLGIAPLTSMYWYGENSRAKSVDWRPEIHDSDGLLMHNGNGEQLWRPLNNPPRLMTNSFVDKAPRGFGLMQRDRSFDSYADSVLDYHKRPSAWIEPLDDWGKGAVQLLEIPTDDEIHDNIVAYWVSDDPMRQGTERGWRYRLSWTARVNAGPERKRARVLATQSGTGGIPEQARPAATRRFVVDFEQVESSGIPQDSLPEANVSVSRGRLLRHFVRPVSEVRTWRLIFDLEADGDAALDLRADLTWERRSISETWIYQTFPGTWPNARPDRGAEN